MVSQAPSILCSFSPRFPCELAPVRRTAPVSPPSRHFQSLTLFGPSFFFDLDRSDSISFAFLYVPVGDPRSPWVGSFLSASTRSRYVAPKIIGGFFLNRGPGVLDPPVPVPPSRDGTYPFPLSRPCEVYPPQRPSLTSCRRPPFLSVLRWEPIFVFAEVCPFCPTDSFPHFFSFSLRTLAVTPPVNCLLWPIFSLARKSCKYVVADFGCDIFLSIDRAPQDNSTSLFPSPFHVNKFFFPSFDGVSLSPQTPPLVCCLPCCL